MRNDETKQQFFFDQIQKANTGIAVAGVAAGVTDMSILSKYHWLGKNLKPYDHEWGGNGYTGGRSIAVKAARTAKFIDTVLL